MKLIIDIPYEAYYTFKCEFGRGNLNALAKIIANGIPYEERPQGEFAEKLKDRIEESVCKYCRMNKQCELCEISRVFQIITLTVEEQKGGTE